MPKALNNIDKYSWPKCTQTTKIVLLKLVSQVSHNLLLKARTKVRKYALCTQHMMVQVTPCLCKAYRSPFSIWLQVVGGLKRIDIKASWAAWNMLHVFAAFVWFSDRRTTGRDTIIRSILYFLMIMFKKSQGIEFCAGINQQLRHQPVVAPNGLKEVYYSGAGGLVLI